MRLTWMHSILISSFARLHHTFEPPLHILSAANAAIPHKPGGAATPDFLPRLPVLLVSGTALGTLAVGLLLSELALSPCTSFTSSESSFLGSALHSAEALLPARCPGAWSARCLSFLGCDCAGAAAVSPACACTGLSGTAGCLLLRDDCFAWKLATFAGESAFAACLLCVRPAG